jgi:hypothetical protein
MMPVSRFFSRHPGNATLVYDYNVQLAVGLAVSPTGFSRFEVDRGFKVGVKWVLR